jgi:2-phospho-L-lactate guanylyltransferase
MRTLAILPIKSFEDAKQRLADLLGAGSRQALAQAMFSDVLHSLRRVRRLDAIAVVTADQVARSAALGYGASVVHDDEQSGQSAAAMLGIRHAMGSGFERVLIVPGDTPLLDPLEVDRLLGAAAAEGLDAVIVPDRHGEGTNALALRPPDALEPSFGQGSLERHLDAVRNAGLAHRVERAKSLLLDVDTPADLAELSAELERQRGRAPMTNGAVRQLDRARVRAAVGARAAVAGSGIGA